MTRLTPSTLAILVLILFPAIGAAASEKGKVSAVPVSGAVSMLSGKGGNIGLFVGADGTFLIDDQFAPLTEEIVGAIEKAGGETPRFLINTHYHGDHTGGNENFGSRGTLIFSHDNVRERLQEGSYLAAFDRVTPPASPTGLPVVTFAEEITFHLNGDTLLAIHVPHAHTDGDSFIRFEKANVIHAGDLFFNGFYPFIDVAHGGSLKGMIAGTERILALADGDTRIIPGHGPLGTTAELESFRQMLTTAYERLLDLKKKGKSVQEAIASKPLEGLDAEWGDGMFTSDRWIELVWPGVY